MKLAVGIATAGRREVLAQTLLELQKSTRAPDAVFICPVSDDDVPDLQELSLPIEVLSSPPGLTKQRNAILSAAQGEDIIVFLDDDFFVSRSFLGECERVFDDHSDVVVVTGSVIADGIHGPGLAPSAGRDVLEKDVKPDLGELIPTYGAYGCNMACRMAPIRSHQLTFDEQLPLYGWQEDIDFSRQLSVHGRVVRATSVRGVHLGSKRGRSSGVRLGYSQIANPIYLIRKGTLSTAFARRLMVRNFLKNAARSLYPEPHVDRIGRLKGNLIALFDWTRGQLHPERIFSL